MKDNNNNLTLKLKWHVLVIRNIIKKINIILKI